MALDRRDFMKLLGAGGTTLLAYKLVAARDVRAASLDSGSAKVQKAMLYDSSKCVGCRACQTACRSWNKLPPESIGQGLMYDNPPDLSAKTWTLIKVRESAIDGRAELILCKYQCMHCTNAACVKTCPTGALTHHEMGFVFYDENKCSGCGYCKEACPFDVPHLSGSEITGAQRMHKCTFDPERVTQGRSTACAEACPTGALLFGDRDELVTVGRDRINDLKSNYPNATFYGENEVGGLHVMYILKEAPYVYVFPAEPRVSGSISVRQDLLKPVSYAIVGLTALGLGLNYLVARARVKDGKE